MSFCAEVNDNTRAIYCPGCFPSRPNDLPVGQAALLQCIHERLDRIESKMDGVIEAAKKIGTYGKYVEEK